ncbi:hypothetical protein [Niveibacterium sp. COAC-50]|uniref:hypothetical protein n=1 Tax=Niveibacterium sp. COAC-50 TaxID=2729384 RepID=UPI001555B7EC|nr:hypothetical protein [Niveibacterium sp. COAC-50]
MNGVYGSVLALIGSATIGWGSISEAAPSEGFDFSLSGYCRVVGSRDNLPDNQIGGVRQPNYISPLDAVEAYSIEHGAHLHGVAAQSIEIVEPPKHGKLVRVPDGVRDGTVFRWEWEYSPQDGYRGLDGFVAVAQVGGKKIKVAVQLVTVGIVADAPYRETAAHPEYRLANNCELRSKVRAVGWAELLEAQRIAKATSCGSGSRALAAVPPSAGILLSGYSTRK